MHNSRLPDMITEIYKTVSPADIAAVSVSDKPRNTEGSYMPVFLAGLNCGRIITETLGIPLYAFSHQEGHIESVMYDFDIAEGCEFIFAHLSGGTSEFLVCRKLNSGYSAEIAGATLDISIGQLLDRTGVRLGYDFPAGKYLDKIACEREVTTVPSKVKINDGYFNLSGIETQVQKEIDLNSDAIVPGLFKRISELIVNESVYVSDKTGIKNVYIAGGVAASSALRQSIDSADTGSTVIRFGNPVLSGDNAVGTARLGERKYNGSYSNGNK